MRKHFNIKNQAGFSLAEVILVLAIIGFAATAAYISWQEGTIREKTTTEKLLILSDLRLVGLEMMKEARNSNRFYVFADYPANVDNDGNVTGGTQKGNNQTGNYLVLESLGVKGDVIERIGYFINSADGALIKYRQIYNGTGSPPMPQNNPPSGTNITNKTILDNVEGDHTVDTNALFLNYANRSILVQGKFIKNTQNLAAGSTQEIKRAFTYQLQPLQIR